MALTADTPVPTANGWVRAADLRVGDVVFNPSGGAQPVKVVQTYIPDSCYRVQFDDGLTLEGDRRLTLKLQTKNYRDAYSKWIKNRGKKYSKPNRSNLAPRTMHELYKGDLRHPDGRWQYSVQNVEPLAFPWVDLPVPPYVFGIWFGSLGPTGRHYVRTMDVEHVKKRLRQYGFTILVKKRKNGTKVLEFRPSVKDSFLFAGAEIPKNVPFYYILSAPEQRRELLEGILDSGTCNFHAKLQKHAIFDKRMDVIRRFQSLLESLGYKTVLDKRPDRAHYNLFFRKNPKNSPLARRFVRKVAKVEPKACVHVAADDQIVVGEGFIPVC
jgi:replicative DNA helicase